VKETMKTVVLFPAGLAVVLAVVRRMLGEWKWAGVLVWLLFLSVMAAVWVPAILVPHLRRQRARD
jgi:hypothetical protein